MDYFSSSTNELTAEIGDECDKCFYGEDDDKCSDNDEEDSACDDTEEEGSDCNDDKEEEDSACDGTEEEGSDGDAEEEEGEGGGCAFSDVFCFDVGDDDVGESDSNVVDSGGDMLDVDGVLRTDKGGLGEQSDGVDVLGDDDIVGEFVNINKNAGQIVNNESKSVNIELSVNNKMTVSK